MVAILFIPGGLELAVLGIVLVVLIFGASRLPDVANAIGRLGGEFKAGRKESEEMIDNLKEQASEQAEKDEGDEPVSEAATSEN